MELHIMLNLFLYFGVLDKDKKLYLDKTNVYMTIWELGILVIDGKVLIFYWWSLWWAGMLESLMVQPRTV